jgi:hypothetical protein
MVLAIPCAVTSILNALNEGFYDKVSMGPDKRLKILLPQKTLDAKGSVISQGGKRAFPSTIFIIALTRGLVHFRLKAHQKNRAGMTAHG